MTLVVPVLVAAMRADSLWPAYILLGFTILLILGVIVIEWRDRRPR